LYRNSTSLSGKKRIPIANATVKYKKVDAGKLLRNGKLYATLGQTSEREREAKHAQRSTLRVTIGLGKRSTQILLQSGEFLNRAIGDDDKSCCAISHILSCRLFYLFSFELCFRALRFRLTHFVEHTKTEKIRF
jgi:hypothetical protein